MRKAEKLKEKKAKMDRGLVVYVILLISLMCSGALMNNRKETDFFGVLFFGITLFLTFLAVCVFQ